MGLFPIFAGEFDIIRQVGGCAGSSVIYMLSFWVLTEQDHLCERMFPNCFKRYNIIIFLRSINLEFVVLCRQEPGLINNN